MKEYVDKIKRMSTYVDTIGHTNDYGVYRERDIYECNYYNGKLTILFPRDLRDTPDEYYNFVEYIEHKKHETVISPIMRTICQADDLYKMLERGTPKYIVYSHRFYGEPKLQKPKELKGIKSIGTAMYNEKCNPQVFVIGDDVWVKHTDYFSKTWQPPEDEKIGMPLDYYLKKYFGKSKAAKFIYDDAWGSIILRNEAYVLLKGIVPVIESNNDHYVADAIVDMQKRSDKYCCYRNYPELELEWHRFWESVSSCVKRKAVENVDNVNGEQNNQS